MRIVHLGSKGLPSAPGSGGVERALLEYAGRMARTGHDIIVYQRSPIFERRVRTEHGMQIRELPYIHTPSLAGWSHMLLCLCDALVSLRGVDIWHVHNAANGLFCAPLRVFGGGRVVYHVHGREWRAAKWGPIAARLIAASCFIGAWTAHAVASVCKPGVRVARAWLPRPMHAKLVHVPNGVPRCASAPRSFERPEVPFFLFVGRIVPQKRIDLLIRAFREVHGDIRLLIAGPASYCADFEAVQKAAASEDPRVTWMGPLDHQSIRHLYETCVAVILPSDAEGCSNVLLEALGSGCCIIASAIEENIDVLGQAAIVFTPGDRRPLAAAMSRLLNDPALVEDRRMAASRQARALGGWDETVRQFELIYRAVRQQQRSGAHRRSTSPVRFLV